MSVGLNSLGYFTFDVENTLGIEISFFFLLFFKRISRYLNNESYQTV